MGSLLSSVLGGVWGTVAAAVVSAAVAGAGVGWTVHRIDRSAIDAMKLADAQAALAAAQKAAALQRSQDAVSLHAAVAEADAQRTIVTHTVTVTKEIPVRVQDSAHCITVGLVRVLDAAATGAPPDAVPGTSGQPDDACAAVSWRQFAQALTDDYGNGRQNAEQLTALEGWVRAQEAQAPPASSNR